MREAFQDYIKDYPLLFFRYDPALVKPYSIMRICICSLLVISTELVSPPYTGAPHTIWRYSGKRWSLSTAGKHTRDCIITNPYQVRKYCGFFFNLINCSGATLIIVIFVCRTAAGSISAGLWRIFLMPIDTSKTVMQVEGSDGLDRLRERVLESGPTPLYQGAIASAAATAAGHFPWFTTYNFLNDKLPTIAKEDDILLFLVRSAVLGISASCVSDIVSNSLRGESIISAMYVYLKSCAASDIISMTKVIKTTKQTAGLGDDGKKDISYREALALVIENDGVLGLFGRGLQTRLLTNAIQGALFSVLWKYFQVTT